MPADPEHTLALSTATTSVELGRALADGRYSLERRLRRSGQLEVFLGRDHLLNRPVVVKLCDRGDGTHAVLFKRQAQRAARLNHPSIVAVYDWGEEAGLCYVVAEHVPGPTLQNVLDRRGAMPEAQALGIAEQVAEVLEAAHRQELVHGSLEPRAIVFDAVGQAKVDDFGVSESPAEAVSAYLPPEAAAGRPLDVRSDVFALGAVLAAMLTGAPPGPNRPRLSPLLEPIVARALAADPDARHPSATALHDAVHEARVELLSALVGATHHVDGAPPRPTPPADATAAWLSPPRATGWWGGLDRRSRCLAVGSAACALLALALLVPGFLRVGSSGQVSQARVASASAAATPAKRSGPAGQPAGDAAGCRFAMGFATLHDKIPNVVGDCVENEHWVPERGQTVQRTTKGLLVWRKSDGLSAFTDGYRTWLDGPNGVQERLNTQRFPWEREG